MILSLRFWHGPRKSLEPVLSRRKPAFFRLKRRNVFDARDSAGIGSGSAQLPPVSVRHCVDCDRDSVFKQDIAMPVR